MSDSLVKKVADAMSSAPLTHDRYNQARAAIRVLADWAFHASNDDGLLDADAVQRRLLREAEEKV